jgi:hypothetical protein
MTYARTAIPPSQVQRIAKRRPNLNPADVVPVGAEAFRDLLQRYIDVGFSKFVVRPAEPPASWSDALDQLAEDVLSLQT